MEELKIVAEGTTLSKPDLLFYIHLFQLNKNRFIIYY